LSEGTTVLY